MPFKPMLAGKAPEDLSTLLFPLLVSPKLDGIRCIIRDGVAVSRKLIPIPNKFVQTCIGGMPEGLDGELMLELPGSFAKVSSAVMSVEGEPDFTFQVFDRAPPHGAGDVSYRVRYERLDQQQRAGRLFENRRAVVVPHLVCNDLAELASLEEEYVAQGYEGIMIRSPDGAYKFGRSTTREGGLLKLKRFEDAEAVVIGVEEQMHNANEATTDNLGRTKRSSHAAGKVGMNMLGALVCRMPSGAEFNVGTGFTAVMRAYLWNQYAKACANQSAPEAPLGRIVKYKFQPSHVGTDGAPCPAVFLGFRDARD